MEYLEQVHAFAQKWMDKFRNQKIDYVELVDHCLADECEALGFQMDCGNAFSEQYGNAVYDYKELDHIIDEITDIQLLGSAIYSRWRYFNHWAYDAVAILQFENRSWFILALGRLMTLSGENLFIFTGVLKKIYIVSNQLGYGLCPEPGEEVEQHITINSDGNVCFEAYAFGKNGGSQYEKSRTKKLQFSMSTVTEIMSAFNEYFSNEYDEIFATDIGDWYMELTNEDNKIYKFRGSLCSKLQVDGVDLSDLVRDSLEMPDLYMFDGNDKLELANRNVHHCDTDIIYCSVVFAKGDKSYYYIADDDSINVGDFVVVPAGADNHEANVHVEKKEYFAKEDVPLPVERTKHILRKCTNKGLGR